nr:E3 ubiquitin-protein ligase RMA1-like [Ipomoea batatas]
MGDNSLDGMMTDLDMNHDPPDPGPPSDPVLGFGSFLNDLQTAYNRIGERIDSFLNDLGTAHNNVIEERIRQLEAVTARVRARNTWRQARNSVGVNSVLVEENVYVEGSGDVAGMNMVPGRGCKRDSSHLVAKALAMDSEAGKVEKDVQGFFYCNICLEMAREPVLTCCGHLYCWMCFFQLPYVYSTMKECPVCKGEVTDATVIPIYGNGNRNYEKELESGLKIPPRPKAQRVESVRQQRGSRGLSHIRVAQALGRIRASMGLGDQPQQQLSGGSNVSSITGSQESQNPNSNSPVFSRVRVRILSENSASLSSQGDNAQRIFEDFAPSTGPSQQRISPPGLPIGDDVMRDVDSFGRDDTFPRTERQILDSTTEINSPASIPSSSRASDVSDSVTRLENLITATLAEINMHVRPASSSSSSQRRLSLLRLSDIDSLVSRETRRRRLN